ncbi:MAG: hypothetical protein HQM08_17185 [Candidatus Riflebacteria bacterium]|nr:hypothetical protein [Candidatus Riflebacteria bacterium]
MIQLKKTNIRGSCKISRLLLEKFFTILTAIELLSGYCAKFIQHCKKLIKQDFCDNTKPNNSNNFKNIPEIGFKVIIIVSTFFIFFSGYAFSEPSQETETFRKQLEIAFSNAFSSSENLRGTHFFDLLGYTNEQINTFTGVTPNPSGISIAFDEIDPIGNTIKNLKVEAKKTHYYKLLIDSCVLKFPNVKIDFEKVKSGKLLFQEASDTDVETFVAPSEILKLFEYFASARKLSHLSMKIERDEVVVSGRVKKGFFTVSFNSYGKSVISGERKMDFQCRKLVLNGFSLPNAVIRQIFSGINPVFDCGKTALNLVLMNICNRDGFVVTNAIIKRATQKQ